MHFAGALLISIAGVVLLGIAIAILAIALALICKKKQSILSYHDSLIYRHNLRKNEFLVFEDYDGTNKIYLNHIYNDIDNIFLYDVNYKDYSKKYKECTLSDLKKRTSK